MSGNLLQRFLHESPPETLRNIGSGSRLALANDTAAHYTVIRCPCKQTVGPTVCN